MLAGYMLVFTGEMSGRHPLLNLHPAAPGGPVGTWQEVTWQLIESQAEESGVMIHLATEELDEGPVVAHCAYSLRGPSFDPLWAGLGSRPAADVRESEREANALFREIRRHGSARELPFVVETLRAFAGGQVRIESGRVVDSEGREMPGGLDLTAEIDAAVTGELEAARS
jgi:folate-dependent phosphoribosylglycinamide formyltransferase PurN